MTAHEAMNEGPEAVREYIEAKISVALGLIHHAFTLFPPRMLLGLMSGGNDSIPACYIASLHHSFSGMLHINTETGIEDTHQHVRDLCRARDWALYERRPSEYRNGDGELEPISYREFVLEHGFPGPAQHGRMYQRLKQRQLECFEREQGFKPKEGECVLYVSGGRKSESKRRTKNIREDNLIQREGRRIWVSAIWDWDRLDCVLARQYAKIPENPVSKKIGMSGECLCGAYAHKPELENLRQHYPDVAADIDALTKEVRAKGFPWDWDDEPPRWYLKQLKSGQIPMFAEEDIPLASQHLCHSCNKNGRAEETE